MSTNNFHIIFILYKIFEMIITESFNIKNGDFKKKDGSTVKIAYIDPYTSTNTYQYKDTIKNKFGGMWLNQLKTWGWFLNNNPEAVYQTKIKPCLEWLDQQINDNRDIVGMIDKLIQEVGSNPTCTNKEEIQNKLAQFKEELINTVSDDEFKQMMSPIIKFKQAQGHQFSLLNAILVYVQDPEATLVKSKGNWKKFNKEVEDGAPAIWLWIPTNFTKYTAEEKEEITQNFLKRNKVANVKDLHPGQQEKLKVQLSGTNPRSFEIGPYFYDIRFTTQIPGTEDMVGSNKHDIQWFDDSGEETNETKLYFNALLELVKSSGVKVDYVQSLGGARGVSKSGSIDLLSNQKINTGLINTLVHEFAHELLHQKYLKNNNKELSEYFVGTSEGRGKVEQQAELCAWIVMKNFGYDMPTNINYVGIWGLDQSNAAEVFDSVANVAQYIVKGIDKNLNLMSESRILKESISITGRDVANMLGLGKLYDKSKQMQFSNKLSIDNDEVESNVKENKKRTVVLKESELRNLITKSIKNILYERRNRR